ncbi:DUF4159 domain-containing protein [uncultured Odoribacter sp.]|uniref:DUF4159 domain-containing protein n=1 Tax=uncultured Odoribacter sp. TaxID=876416 RepID=UPI002624C772|nr:DUF4159 domain-containing protein [uncultured Odoribacter sp.]
MEDILKILLIIALFMLIPRWIWGQKTKQKIALLKYKGIGQENVKKNWMDRISFSNKNLNTDFARCPVGVEPADQAIFQYPFVYMDGAQVLILTEAEKQNLREYTAAGGFLQIHVPEVRKADFFSEINQIFPEAKKVKIEGDHPIFNQKYKFPEDFPYLQQFYKKDLPVWGITTEDRLCVCCESFERETEQFKNTEMISLQIVPEEILKIEANILSYVFQNQCL